MPLEIPRSTQLLLTDIESTLGRPGICEKQKKNYRFRLNAPRQLVYDVSKDAKGTLLHQGVDDTTQPFGFFNMRLALTESRCSTLGREL